MVGVVRQCKRGRAVASTGASMRQSTFLRGGQSQQRMGCSGIVVRGTRGRFEQVSLRMSLHAWIGQGWMGNQGTAQAVCARAHRSSVTAANLLPGMHDRMVDGRRADAPLQHALETCSVEHALGACNPTVQVL